MRFRMLGPLVVSGAEVTAGRERTVLAMLLLRRRFAGARE